MRVTMATSPGHVGRDNEDFVGAVPASVVLLDGAGIPGAEQLCRHGVAWYAHSLGAAVLGRLSRGPGVDLVGALAESIDEVTGRHRGTCDVADPSSPQATVAMVRVTDGRLDHLVLGDSYVVLAGVRPVVLADPRELDVRAAVIAEHDDLAARIDAFRARRNRPGGYWIAKDDPAAAAEAVTGSVPLASLDDVAVLSNGVRRLVDPYGVLGWAGLMERLRAGGPDDVLSRLRAVEPHPDGAPDDATVAYCALRSATPPA
ncbi:protein phosphatase 2C domain-containing protein [Nocardioides sp. YIM 152315]|uniref:protein phosphatase 2C domain-containing protein n=1 Tax=Nocardioides sp. YIM 152315 TaxID=3031760 RepID=UPI0023DBCA8E|nr:protein phosphatase 2C domain-containing protein [Nocardioides sp. YIM 152315]MDF1602715.1 protein phosphatase 2C domain-containing protein [Nocardioides sp. YIM 152315]